MSNWIAIEKLSKFRPGSQKRNKHDPFEIALFNVEGKIYAIGDRCPHADGSLSEGPVEGKTIICPWHEAVFELETGDLIEGPCFRGVPSYKVRIDGDDILVELPDEETD